jgi:hypothetical protein
VSDDDIPTSGSRWEPADGGAEGSTERIAGTPARPPLDPEEPVAAHGAVPIDELRPPRSPRRLRGRSAVAAAGVGLVLAGGLGGFAIGHALAGDDVPGAGTVTDADQDGVPGDGPGRPGFGDGDRRGPDGGFPDGTDPGDTSSDTGGDGGTA